ncbi:MAG: methyltransferase domain-containing protein [Rhodothermales bacterium]|nr:methyltransferase domain-containing protein [Rhodothermales bacterium]
MPALADHLLRTFAAVPVGSRVLDLGASPHATALDRLGLEVYACAADGDALEALRGVLEEAGRVTAVPRLDALGYPDAFFDWVVAVEGIPAGALVEVLREARRVLVPGGWIYAAAPLATPAALTAHADAAGLALAEAPRPCGGGSALVRGIYRRVEPGTPL